VARRLDAAPVPDGVRVADYGIRGVHLAYDLLDGQYATLIMVDALPTGELPGTVSVLEVDDDALTAITSDDRTLDSHSMHPEAVLAALHSLGGQVGRVLVIGCEPASVEPGMGLSEPVAGAVAGAARLTVSVAEAEAAALRARECPPIEMG
jgi:hydrogenase maturation protease